MARGAMDAQRACWTRRVSLLLLAILQTFTLAAADDCNVDQQLVYQNCIVECDDVTCVPSMQALDCLVEIELFSPSRGSFGMQPLKAEQAYMKTCHASEACAELLSQVVTGVEDCCPGGGGCPRGFPEEGKCTMECAPNVMAFYAMCGLNPYNESHADTEELVATEDQCYKALLDSVAKTVYEMIAAEFDVPLSLWLMTAVPFFLFMFLAFFGRNISTLFRMITGFLATSLPLIIPVLLPYFDDCKISMVGESGCGDTPPFTAALFVQLFMSFYGGCLGAYASRKNPSFGNAVQGYLLAYVLVVQTFDLWAGFVRNSAAQDGSDVDDFVEWLVLIVIAGVGTVLAVLNIIIPDVINVVASSFIGIFMSMQIFCVIGLFNNWFFTFQVSAIAMLLGVAGCTVHGCWGFLACWIVLALVGIYIQLKTGSSMKIDKKENPSGMDVCLYRVATGFQVLLDLDAALADASEYHAPEELEILVAKNAAVYAQVATFLFDFTLTVLGVAVQCGVAELVFRGQITKPGEVVLMLMVFLVATCAVCLTIYEMRAHNISGEDAQDRRRIAFDHYIWGAMWLVPFAVTASIFIWGCALEGDPIGVDAFFEMEAHHGENNIVAPHLKVIGVALVGMVIMLVTTVYYVSNHLGGVLYLSINLSQFTAMLLTGYGVFATAMGVYYGGLHEMSSEEIGGGGVYVLVAIIGVFMVLQSLPGLAASKAIWKENADQAKNLYRWFGGSLVLTLLLNTTVFVVAGLYVSSIESSLTDEHWTEINATMYEGSPDLIMTRAEFVETAKSGFRFMVTLGAVTSFYLIVGVVSSLYIGTRSNEVAGHAQQLIAKHQKEYLDADEARALREKMGKENMAEKVSKIDETIASQKGKRGKRRDKEKEIMDNPMADEGETPPGSPTSATSNDQTGDES